MRPDLPPHSDNCKRYHTYCSNEDQTGSPVCPSLCTGRGGEQLHREIDGLPSIWGSVEAEREI